MRNEKNIHFPLTIIDNYYSNPDDVRKYALSQKFESNNEGKFPGIRTAFTLDSNPELHDLFCNKFMSTYYDFSLCQAQWVITSQFQISEARHPDKNNLLNSGWQHRDTAALLAGVVYLSPDADPDAGTSMYEAKEDINVNDVSLINKREQYYKSNVYDDDYIKLVKEWDSKFVKTVSVSNIYNRLVIYDSNIWHKESNINAGVPRLTQIFFVYGLKCQQLTPGERIRNQKIALYN